MAVEQEDKLFDEVETVSEFTYLGDRVCAGGGCEAAVTARTRCWWVICRECGELIYGRRFPLMLKGSVCRSCVRPRILYGSEAWCLNESEMGILGSSERSMVRAMCGVQLKDRNGSTDLMFMLCLNETMNLLAMANSVRRYGHVLRREDGHVWRRSLDFEVEGQNKKGRPKMIWKRQVEEESMKVGLRRKVALYRSKWSVGVNQITAGFM